MKISDKDKRLLMKALAFIIPFITILIGFIIGGFAPFGNKDIMTAAGYEDMLPYLTEFHDLVFSGNPFVYSNRIGTGYDFSAVITYYLSDPTNMIILLFPKASILAVIDILYVIKISLAGLFAYFMFGYLSQSCSLNTKDNSMSFLNLGLALAYALSSAMVGYGMNITWLSAMAILPLVIMGLENIIRERKPVMYLITFAITIVLNFNIAVIVFIFSVLYLIQSEYQSTRHLLFSILYKTVADILAIGTTMFIILNNIHSSFFNKNYSINFPKANYVSNIYDYIKSMMTCNPISKVSTYGKGIDVYCGIFVIIFIIIYMINGKISIWNKIRFLFVYAFLVTGTIVTTAQYILDGFNTSLITKSIFSFTIVLYTLIITQKSIFQIHEMKIRHFILSGVLSLAMIIITMIFCRGYDSTSPFIFSIEVIIAVTILSVIWMNNNINYNKYIIILVVIILVETLFSNVSHISSLGKKAIPYNKTVSCSIDTCINDIHADYPDAKILIYEPYHTNATPLSESILGFDYVIITNDTGVPDYNLKYIGDLYGLHVYQNPDAIKNGIFMDSSIIEWESTNEFYFSASNILAREIVGSENVFKPITCTTSIDNTTYSDSSIIQYNANESGDLYTNLSNVIHIGDVKRGKAVSINYKATFEDSNASFVSGEYAILNKENYKKLLSDAIEGSINGTDSSIMINAPSSGYLMIPYDYSECSTISINDNSVDSLYKKLFSANTTLLKIDEGQNIINITYSPIWLIRGLYASLLFLILTIITVAFFAKESIISSIDISCNKKSFERFLSDNKVYIYTILISIGLYIIGATFNQSTPFGTGSIIVSDGYLETYPTFMYNISQIKHFDFSTLSYTLGFMGGGTSISSFLMFRNPLRLIPLLFSEGNELLAFNTLYAIEFILIGPSIIFYLTHRPHGKRMKKTELKLIPIALSYNLSSFVLCYYPFAGFLEMVLILPLIMLAMDRLIYQKKYIAYVLLLSLFMIDSTYMAFLLCEFLVLYFFTLEHNDFKSLIKNGIRFALASISAALISIYTLLPFYNSISSTNYVERDTVSSKASLDIFSQNIIGNINDVEVLHRLSLVTEDWTIANTYCGLLLILILPLFILNKNIKLSTRIKRIVVILLLFFSYGNELLNYIFHGFHRQANVPNRFAPFVIFLLVCVLYDTLINYKDLLDTKKTIVYTLFSILLSILIVYNHTDDTSHNYIVSLVFICGYLGGYLFYKYKKKPYKYSKFILALLAIELFISSIYTGLHVWGIDTTNELNNIKLSKLSSKYNLDDDGLMHTELIYGNFLNSSCIIHTNSISEFSSTLPIEKTSLVNYWGCTGGVNNIEYRSGNPLANIMLNTKYFYNNLYTEDSETPAYMTKIDEISNILLYEDPYVAGSGLFFEDSLELDDSKKGFENEIDYQNYISNKLVGQNLYDIIEFTDDINQYDSEHSYILMQQTDQYNATPLRLFTESNTSGILFLEYDNIISYLGTAEEGNQNTYDIVVYETYNNLEHIQDYVKIGILNEETLKKLNDYLESTRIQDLKANDTTISCTSDKTNSGTLYIPLPNYSNWHAYIDDKEVKKIDYMNGIGIHIPEGQHNIKLEYIPAKNTIPTILSVIFILLFITFCIVDAKRKNKNKAQQTSESE